MSTAMGGVGLSRLWASHPRVAFVAHLIVTLLIGVFAISLVYSGAAWGSVLVAVSGFVLMAGSLVLLTWFAIKDRWQPDGFSYGSEPSRLPGLQTVWGSTRTRERVLWSLFAVAFVVGLALLGFERSIVGLALFVLSIALAVVAMRART